MKHLFRDLSYAFGELGLLPCFLFVVGFVVFVAFLSAVVRVLSLVEPANRRIEPGQVWLNLIPGFNLVWMVVTVERVGESIRNEFVSRGRHKKTEAYGKTSGLAWLMLTGIGLPFGIAESPCVSAFWVIALIYWIAYWVQLSGYARRLRTDNATFSSAADEGW